MKKISHLLIAAQRLQGLNYVGASGVADVPRLARAIKAVILKLLLILRLSGTLETRLSSGRAKYSRADWSLVRSH